MTSRTRMENLAAVNTLDIIRWIEHLYNYLIHGSTASFFTKPVLPFCIGVIEVTEKVDLGNTIKGDEDVEQKLGGMFGQRANQVRVGEDFEDHLTMIMLVALLKPCWWVGCYWLFDVGDHVVSSGDCCRVGSDIANQSIQFWDPTCLHVDVFGVLAFKNLTVQGKSRKGREKICLLGLFFPWNIRPYFEHLRTVPLRKNSWGIHLYSITVYSWVIQFRNKLHHLHPFTIFCHVFQGVKCQVKWLNLRSALNPQT